MSGWGGDVFLGVREKMVDVCCLPEMRRRGQGSRMLGFWGRNLSCGGLENSSQWKHSEGGAL